MVRLGSYKRKKSSFLLTKIALVFGTIIFLSVAIFFLVRYFTSQITLGSTEVNVMELWNNGSYEEIITNGQEELKNHPMKVEALVFSGFAYFHQAIAEGTVEKKLPLINAAIFSLRKALIVFNPPLKPEIHYILGKAYFHKGKFYVDLAIKNLRQALEEGYTAEDINEYLGLSYSLAGRFQDASDYFLKAIKTNPSGGLFWPLGQTYYQLGKLDEAVLYIRQAIEKTQDRGLEQKCRFLLGEIFFKLRNYEDAKKEYQNILERNSNSADAHYYLGEVYLAQGQKKAAKKQWRNAFKIDPLHFNANQRLFN